MFCVDEVRILMVYLQDIGNHSPNEHGDWEYLAEDGVLAELFGGGDIEWQTDEEEQQPPFQAPGTRQQGDEARHEERDDDEHGAGDEGLLDGFVDEVDIACDDGLGNIGQQGKQALYLCRHPAKTLTLEIVFVGDFLVEDVDVGFIVDVDFLFEK